MGFNGISVALLASSNPIGTVFSALFISHISDVYKRQRLHR